MNFHNFTLSAKKRLCCRDRAVLAKTMSLCSVIVTLCWQKCQCGLMKNPKQGKKNNFNACLQACRGELFLLIEEWVKIGPYSSYPTSINQGNGPLAMSHFCLATSCDLFEFRGIGGNAIV